MAPTRGLYGPGGVDFYQGAPGWWVDQFTALTALVDVLKAAVSVAASTASVTAAVAAEATARTNADALLIPLTQRAAANGVATLDGATKIPVAQVPDLSGTYVGTGVLPLNLRTYMAGATATAAEYQTAMAAAVAAARPLYHPGGTTAALGATTLSPPAGLIWYGDGNGSLITSSQPGTYAFVSATSRAGIRIRGLRFRRDVVLTAAEGPFDAALYFTTCDDLIVEDVRCEGSMRGIITLGCTNFRFRRVIGYRQGDVSVSALWTGAVGPGNPPAILGVIEDCWSIEAGFQLASGNALPEPNGPVGSGFLCTQSDVHWKNNGAVNPRANTFESGDGGNGIVVDGMTCIGTRPTALLSLLINNITNAVVRRVTMRLAGGSTGAIYQPDSTCVGNVIEDFDILVTPAVGGSSGINVGNGVKNTTVRRGKVSGARVTFDARGNTPCLLEQVEVSNSLLSGFSIVGPTSGNAEHCVVRQNRAFDNGNASTSGETYGFTFDGGAMRIEDNLAGETRIGAARKQTHGYHVANVTAAWDDNGGFNNITALRLESGTNSFVAPYVAVAQTQAGTPSAPTPTEWLRFNAPAADTHGPFGVVVGGALFQATFDRVLYGPGYNQADGGGRTIAAEPSIGQVVETDYDDGTKRNLEIYWDYHKASGATGPDSFRPIFLQINRATGALSFELNSDAGFSFNRIDGSQTNWGSLGPTGLNIVPLAGQSAGLSLGWKTGGINFLQIGNNTANLLIQPSSAGSVGWNFGIGSAVSVMQLSPTGGLRLSLGSSTAAGVQIPADASYAIRNAADNADLVMLRNIGNEMYIGGNSAWSGITFQAGGSGIFRLTPTLIAMHGAGGSPQKSAVVNADGTLADITAKFNLMLAYWRNRGDVAA